MAEDVHARSASAIARRFVEARLTATALPAFPGPPPATLDEAYECQEHAIELWPDVIAGWKVGLIGAELAAELGEDRLAGPIFRRSVQRASGDATVRFPIFPGGFAAIEAEYVLVVARDAPPGKTEWTREEACDMVEAVHAAIETACSPLATINDLGPTAVVADFGNNAGLIVGPPLVGWRSLPVERWRCRSFVAGRMVGEGHAGLVPGGPFESLRFLLTRNARRNRPLKRGDLVSCGAVTGVHTIAAGQTASVDFEGCGEIRCEARLPAGARDVS